MGLAGIIVDRDSEAFPPLAGDDAIATGPCGWQVRHPAGTPFAGEADRFEPSGGGLAAQPPWVVTSIGKRLQ